MSIEQEIQAKGLTAPRVTPADIEAEIVVEHYFGAHEASAVGDQVGFANEDTIRAVMCLTFCVLVLRNGFTVTGESACASPENFDAEIGRKIARQNALEKMWPLLGFRLRDKLAAGLATASNPCGVIELVEPAPAPADTLRFITPTIGRKVWFYPGASIPKGMMVLNDRQPLDATIVYVWHNRMVNLAVLDHAGNPHTMNSIDLVQPSDKAVPDRRAEWMPYQVKQATGG